MVKLSNELKMEQLPKLLSKKEAYYTTDLVKWVNKNIMDSCLIEIKYTKTNVLPANSIKDHQHKTLSSKTYTKKLSDSLQQRQPADIIHFHNPRNYIIVIFNKDKFLIRYKDFPDYKKKFTKNQAEKIGEKIVF